VAEPEMGTIAGREVVQESLDAVPPLAWWIPEQPASLNGWHQTRLNPG